MDKIEQAAVETSLGWKVNLLYVLLRSASLLVEDVDSELHKFGEHFRYDKKRALNRYFKLHRDAERQLDEFGLDEATWRGCDEDVVRFDSALADSNEIVRLLMRYFNCASTIEASQSVFRHIATLPSSERFDEKDIERYNMKHPWITGKGDRIRSRFGEGTIESEANDKAWLINMDDGTQRVLREEDFEVLAA